MRAHLGDNLEEGFGIMRKKLDLSATQRSLQDDQTPHDNFSARMGNYEISHTPPHSGHIELLFN